MALSLAAVGVASIWRVLLLVLGPSLPLPLPLPLIQAPGGVAPPGADAPVPALSASVPGVPGVPQLPVSSSAASQPSQPNTPPAIRQSLTGRSVRSFNVALPGADAPVPALSASGVPQSPVSSSPRVTPPLFTSRLLPL